MFENKEDLKVIWRSRFNLAPIVGKKMIIYGEDVLLSMVFIGLAVFTLATILLWQINLSIFPRPPNPIFINGVPDFLNANPKEHLIAWFKMFIHSFSPFFSADVHQYRLMGSWLEDRGYLYILTGRFLIAGLLGVFAGIWMAINRIKNPIPSEILVHKRGMRVLIGLEAQIEFAKQTAWEIKALGAFAKMAVNNWFSNWRLVRHSIIVGASGTGKSQFLEPHIKQAIKQGLKVVILDPKYEFTMALYDPNDPSMAIIDITDSRSHVWDFSRDINSISKMRRFANSFIPPGEGDAAMWSNAARMLFVGFQVYLSKNFPNYTPRDLADLMTMLDTEQKYFLMKKYFPLGADVVGMIDKESGYAEENPTSFGVKMNLIGFIDGLVDMGRFWNDPDQKRISLFEFMTNPDYPIKTLFIKPNDDERLMSSGLIRSMLNYMISIIDSPNMPQSEKCKGVLFLDEFHAPGKLVTEEAKPTIDKLLDRGRSRGWCAYLAVQDILQLYNLYTENEVEQWKMTVSTFVLTGTPPGKTAQMVSDMIGKGFFDKVHRSYGFDSQTGKRRMGDENIQEHEAPVILPTEISSYLRPTKDGNIRFLMTGVGLNNAFIFEKKIVPLVEEQPAWLPQKEDTNIVNPDSRVVKFLIAEIKKSYETENESSEPIKEEQVDTIPEGEDIPDEPLSLNDDDAEEIKLTYELTDEEKIEAGRKILKELEEQ